MQLWARVAELTKVKTQKGGFAVRCAAGLPFLLEPGMQVSFVPPQIDAPRRAVVESVAMTGESEALVHFDALRCRDVAERLRGCSVLVRRDCLPDGALEGPASVVGYAVRDERFGELGLVADVVQNPAHSLLQVEGPGGEVLVPCVEEFILAIDDDLRVVETRIPDGLLDLQSR